MYCNRVCHRADWPKHELSCLSPTNDSEAQPKVGAFQPTIKQVKPLTNGQTDMFQAFNRNRITFGAKLWDMEQKPVLGRLVDPFMQRASLFSFVPFKTK